MLKTQNFEKQANFPVKNIIWHFSSRLTEHVKCQRTIYNGPKGLSRKIVQVVISIP